MEEDEEEEEARDIAAVAVERTETLQVVQWSMGGLTVGGGQMRGEGAWPTFPSPPSPL